MSRFVSIAARSSRRNKISTRFLRRKRREAAPWWLAAAAGLLLAVGLFLVVPSGGPSSAMVLGDRGSIERTGQTLRLGSQAHAVADGDVLVADGSALLLRFSDVALEQSRLRLRYLAAHTVQSAMLHRKWAVYCAQSCSICSAAAAAYLCRSLTGITHSLSRVTAVRDGLPV